MSEYITIQVGQCGNQIGSEFWPLALQEYGIRQDGAAKLKGVDLQSSFHSFFQIPSEYKRQTFGSVSDLVESEVKARAILIDMETSVIGRYKNSYLRDIFDDEYVVVHYPGSGNNWGEAHCQHGPQFEDMTLYSIRKAVEKCDSLHGFLLLFSVGGGTGSGLGTYILKMLEDHFPNIDRLVTCVYPTGTEDVITCPYNMALATKELIEHASCVIPIENRALLDIVNRQATDKRSIDTMNFIANCKPFQDMNSIIVNMLLNLTSGSRFPGTLNVDLNELSTNMVPFPNLPFLVTGLSPLTISSSNKKKQNREELFAQACSPGNQLVRASAARPVIVGTTLLARGDFTMSDMRAYVDRLQRRSAFAPWSQRAMKIAMCDVPPIGHDASMLALFNTTAMGALLGEVRAQFARLYNKRAHAHHYLQVPGFDESYFDECLEAIDGSLRSYREIERARPLGAPRLPPARF